MGKDSEREIRVSIGASRHFMVGAADPREANFWRGVSSGSWEAETLREFESVFAHADLFLDVGAWIGPMTLAAGAAGLKVVAVEPDPIAVERLRSNVAMNGFDVTVIPRALHSEHGSLALYPGPFGHGDSMSSAVGRDGARDITRTGHGFGEPVHVETVTVEDLKRHIPQDARCVVKVDIEGHEYCIQEEIAALGRIGSAGFNLSLHPRALHNAGRGGVASRLSAYWRTMDLIGRIRVDGRGVRINGRAAPCSISAARKIIFGRRGPKNFAITAAPLISS